MSAVSKAFGNRTSPPSVVPSSVHYLTKQPGLLLLLLLLLFTSCSLSLSPVLQISSFPVFLRLSWRLSEQTNTRGSTASQTAWCAIVCFGCSRARESFLKRHTEVWSSTERPQNKYVPSCLQAQGPFLSSSDGEQENGPTFGSEVRKRCGHDTERLASQWIGCYWVSTLYN